MGASRIPGWPIDHCASAAVESPSTTPRPIENRLKILFMPISFLFDATDASNAIRYRQILTPVDTQTISLNIIKLVDEDIVKQVREDFQAKASVLRKVHDAEAAPIS